MVKEWLRRAVVRTSVPGLLELYRWAYQQVIRGVTRRLQRYRSIQSIYLSRGCARDEILPGISDIDFIVVTSDDSPEIPAIGRTFRRLKKATAGLIDYYPRLVSDRATLFHRWQTSPVWQSRYLEGQRTFRLLHGIDHLAALPPLTEMQKRGAIYAEMNRWWTVLASRVLNPPARTSLLQNVACYKVVAELLRLKAAWSTGDLFVSKAEALAAHDGPLMRRLAQLAAHRFLSQDDAVVDETFQFTVEYFTRLWRTFPEHPFLAIQDVRTQRVEGASGEITLTQDQARHVADLKEHLTTHWPDSGRGMRIVRSAFFDLDDLLIIMEGDEEHLPDAERVRQLLARHERRPALARHMLVFLKFGPVVFPLTPQGYRDLHRGILTAATAPDVFLQLGVQPVYWTAFTRWYLCDWRSNEQWTHAPAQKQRQLERIRESCEEGEIIYPLSADAICREVMH
jgi:hypothetical protein